MRKGKSDTTALYVMSIRTRNTSKRMREDVKRVVRETSEGVCDNVKRRMPVLTGRARAGWGKYTPGLLVMTNNKSNSSDAVWVVSTHGLSIRQGTNVPYTSILNRGHSQQAPAGFIDLSFEMGREELHVRLQRMRLFGG
jgi:hypothetical protein